MGVFIGDVCLSSPTCADDCMHMSNQSPEMQAMLGASYSYSGEHHYGIHPGKSRVAELINSQLGRLLTELSWQLGEDSLNSVDGFMHLGLNWERDKLKPDLSDKFRAAHRTAYLLMGYGIHGTNGLNPVVSVHILNTQVLPRLLYGLEAVVLSLQDIKALNQIYRMQLK